MIADSHAHLAHFKFDGSFCCIVPLEEGYEAKELTREELFSLMKENGIG